MKNTDNTNKRIKTTS